MRETGSHTGITLRKFASTDEVERDSSYAGDKELYVTQYVDCPFRGTYFRKMRVFFIDGTIFPVVCHIDTVWNVHGYNRTELMAKNQWMMDEEKAFMADPRQYLGERRYALLQGLYADIGLDFFGIDFTVLEDGTILVFELNPVMRHSFDHARHFPYLTAYLEEISQAFSDMIANRVRAA